MVKVSMEGPMTVTVTLELPDNVLIQALRQLSPARRQQLLRQLEDETPPVVRVVPATELDKWTGLIAVGGDALEDSERLYE
jgi:hypothetical protein